MASDFFISAGSSVGLAFSSSVLAGRPSAAITRSWVMPATSRVVNGMTIVAPAGAFNTPLNASLVSMSMPPRAVRPAAQPGAAKVNLPLASVVTVSSPASAAPLPLLSHSTVAPLR